MHEKIVWIYWEHWEQLCVLFEIERRGRWEQTGNWWEHENRSFFTPVLRQGDGIDTAKFAFNSASDGKMLPGLFLHHSPFCQGTDDKLVVIPPANLDSEYFRKEEVLPAASPTVALLVPGAVGDDSKVFVFVVQESALTMRLDEPKHLPDSPIVVA